MKQKCIIDLVEKYHPSSEMIGAGLLTIGGLIGGLGLYLITLKLDSKIKGRA